MAQEKAANAGRGEDRDSERTHTLRTGQSSQPEAGWLPGFSGDPVNRAQLYIMKQVGVATLFIVGTLTAVIWLTQSLRFIKFILNRGLPIETFLELTILLLPSFFLVTLPVALFLATMFALNKMTNDRELIVMRSTGLSDLGLAWPIAVLGLIAVGIGYFLSLYLLPVSFRHFKDLQIEIRENVSAGLVQEGAFSSLGKNLTIYVRDRTGDNVYGILVQDDRQADKQFTMMAERGVIASGPNGPRVIMFDGNRQELDRKSGKLSLLYFKSYSFDFAVRKAHKRVWREPNERFLPALLSPDDSGHDRFYRKKLIASGHNRIVTPLYGMTMPLIALVAMLIGQFNKRGQAMRIVLGITAAAALQGIAMGLFSASAKLLELMPLVYLNALLPAVAALFLLSRRTQLRLRLPSFARARTT